MELRSYGVKELSQMPSCRVANLLFQLIHFFNPKNINSLTAHTSKQQSIWLNSFNSLLPTHNSFTAITP